MKVLTAGQTREVDRLAIAGGIPSLTLMENAATRVVEVMEREFAPLANQSVVVLCGKGNNGGDGLAVARLLIGRAARVQTVLTSRELAGDALENLHRLQAAGGEITSETTAATIVVDALLGTGLKGPLTGSLLKLVHDLNMRPPGAKVVAVDIPSGLGGGGECVRADVTVTFTTPKVEHYLAEDVVGKLIVEDIGIPRELVESDLNVSEARDFSGLLGPRARDAHKGSFGHVLVVGGAPGKTGAAAMAGLAALRMGAGLVTVACSDGSRLAPELMTEPFDGFSLERKTVLAVGPGLGPAKELLARLMKEARVPLVIDADALNSIAGTDFRGRGVETVLTPHPGEMTRLAGAPPTDRLAAARAFAQERNVCLVLKGHRTLIALPDGQVWINPSGSPAMAKGGSGDILTGLIAGLIAQFPRDIATAVRGAVWLHGRAGELAAEEWTDKCVLATDLLHYLPRAIRECV